MFESLFQSVLTMSAGASLVILAVLALRIVLRKAPKRFSYILWALVIVRLLCPVFPESGISLMPGDVDMAAVLETVTDQNEETVQSLVPSASVDVPELAPQYPVTQKPSTGTVTPQQPSAGESYQPPMQPLPEQPAIEKPQTQMPKLDGWQIGSVVWLAGIWVMALYGVWSLFRLKSRLAASMALGGGVYLADHIDTPFVMGLFRPKIYLPSYLKLEKAEYIILHEKYHISRFDHVVKLLYFAALCLHWFNPLVWLAFVLMGHDMEMSCDEAVMEKMNRDVRRDYANSLLQLSTGRRKIAPTPLAFGEGDPKGRIKNVLNYRKPHFWIVLVAVVVCVVAAVCLLTNPVKTDKEFLNYPGLQWGMTPEEVKSALELTEENIVIDEGETAEDEFKWNDPPHYVIAVKGLTCFGEETTLARFLFYDYSLTCENFGLETIELYYPDQYSDVPANMNQVCNTISRYYGDPVDQLQNYEWGMSEPKIKTEDVPEGYTYWLSEQNMDAYLTDEQKDVLYELYESANKDKETFIADRALYDLRYQATWLVTAFCNDHYGPSDGYPDKMREEGYTNNYVRISANSKHTVDAYLQYAEDGVLPEAMKPTEPEEKDGLLNYPGLSWGMKLDEVVAALGKTTADFNEMQEEGRDGKSYQLSGVAVSEYIDLTMDVTFRFSAAGGLNGIRIVLPEEQVALEELRSEFVGNYGSNVSNYGYFPVPGKPGVSEVYTDYTEIIAWTSAQTLKEAFPEETLDAYRKAYFPDASDRDWDTYITYKRLATVKTTADEAKFLLEQESSEPPVAVAVFDAEEYVTILENVVQEGPDPLLNYPGLQWGMTPEEVKNALRLRDKQIKSESENEARTDYVLSVTDLECFGEKVNLATFYFTDDTKMGGAYGLYDIQLFYPDEQSTESADLEKILTAMTECYGQPAQEMVRIDFDMNTSTAPVPEGEYHWNSALTLDTWMTPEQKELLYQYQNHNLIDKSDGDRESFDRWLKQRCISWVRVYSDFLGENDNAVREDGLTDYCVYLSTAKTWADGQIKELTSRNGFGPYLQYPMLVWGMDPEVVRLNFEYMGWTVNSDELETRDGLKRIMELSGKDFFGHKVKKLVVEFTGEQETNLKLSFVRVVLDSSVSAADIEKELTMRYGAEPEKYWDCELVDGKYTQQMNKPITVMSAWPSFASLKTRYNDGVLDALRSLYESENGVKVSDEDWAKFAENRYLVSMMFGVNGKANPNREAEDSDCIVIDYDASELIAYDAKVAKIRQSYDAAQLNYPGLDWGMTIEEVKAALGFGDDAIVKVEDRGNVMGYNVEGLPYFNLPTESIYFSFTNNSNWGSKWGLYEVIVFLPDDADMESAKQTVTAYYGEPIDSYSYPDLLSGKTITEKSEEGNDLWLSEVTSGNTFSEAELEFCWQYWKEQYAGGFEITKENVMENLRTTPLTRLNLTDDFHRKVFNVDHPDLEKIKAVRYHSTVYDLEQFFEYHREEVAQIQQSYDAALLNYPGLDWGMTIEEVKAALGFGDDAITEEIEREINVTTYCVENLDYFGMPTESVVFSFSSLAMLDDGERGLYEVIVHLPDDTDMEKAKQTVTAYYGDPIDSYSYMTEDGYTITQNSEEGNDLWLSEATSGNTFSEAEQEFYCQQMIAFYGSRHDFKKENIIECLRTTPLTQMNLSDDLYGKVYNYDSPDREIVKAVRYNSTVYGMVQFLDMYADEIG